jgi:hypothetical protein
MAVNTDPKPGRWILPLVILAMIGFTYFFVGALPEAAPDTTLAGAVTTTTLGDSTGTSSPDSDGGGPVDDQTQTYLDELDAINADLQVTTTEMVAVNAGFDADPREIEYGVAGLRSTDTGQLRQAALEAYTTSAAGFDTEVQNAKNAAGAA